METSQTKKTKAQDESEMQHSAKKKKKLEFETKFGIKDITGKEFFKSVKSSDPSEVGEVLKKHLELNNIEFVKRAKIGKTLQKTASIIQASGQAESDVTLVIDSNLKNKANLRKMLDQLEPAQLDAIKTNFKVKCSKHEEKRPNRVIAAIVDSIVGDSEPGETAFECCDHVEKMLEKNESVKEYLEQLALPQLQSMAENQLESTQKKRDQQQLKVLLFKHFIKNDINPKAVLEEIQAGQTSQMQPQDLAQSVEALHIESEEIPQLVEGRVHTIFFLSLINYLILCTFIHMETDY